jgi:serine phosphatase RsbU (regulator of sigma subunit)
MTKRQSSSRPGTALKRLKAIVRAGELINSSLELDTILQVLLTQTLQYLGAVTGTIYLVERERRELWARTMKGKKKIEIRLPIGRGLAGHVARTGRTIRLKDAYKDKRFYRGIDLESGFTTRTMLCAPMKNRSGRIIGVFQVLNKKRGLFTKEDEEFLKAISIPATIAIENARLHLAEVESQKMQRELEVAAAIQRQILPKVLPSPAGLELSALTKPCRSVGGDFYDVIQKDDGTLVLCVADVSGKGVGAALLVSTFQAALHTYVEFGLPLGTIAARLNRILFEDSPAESFITCVLCTYDPVTRELHYVNAGHNHPFLFRENDVPLQLDKGGIGLGLLPAVTYDGGALKLGEGDVLLLYTDGLTEAMNGTQELFGESRLWHALRTYAHLDAVALSDMLSGEVEAFGTGTQQADDLTLMVAKVTARGA